jgi:hypothetical protein
VSAHREELKLEKVQIENEVKNSTGALREQWRYRMSVWQVKVKAAKEGRGPCDKALK